MLHKNFKEFVELLNSCKVEYLIVGGYALSIHGVPRYTGELEKWIGISELNVSKLITGINEFGFFTLQLSSKILLNQ